MVNSEIRYNRVERFIGEGQDLRISLLKADPGMVGARQCDHRRGKIESHRQCPTLRRSARDETRSAGEVEHPHSCFDPSGVEQIVNKAPRRAGKGRGVVGSRPLPAGMLKITDSLGTEGHRSAAAARATRSARSRWRGSARASTPSSTAASAVSGEPAVKDGDGAYSMLSWIASAVDLPAISAATASATSMPAVTLLRCRYDHRRRHARRRKPAADRATSSGWRRGAPATALRYPAPARRCIR
jgi:hypothetical protein